MRSVEHGLRFVFAHGRDAAAGAVGVLHHVPAARAAPHGLEFDPVGLELALDGPRRGRAGPADAEQQVAVRNRGRRGLFQNRVFRGRPRAAAEFRGDPDEAGNARRTQQPGLAQIGRRAGFPVRKQAAEQAAGNDMVRLSGLPRRRLGPEEQALGRFRGGLRRRRGQARRRAGGERFFGPGLKVLAGLFIRAPQGGGIRGLQVAPRENGVAGFFRVVGGHGARQLADQAGVEALVVAQAAAEGEIDPGGRGGAARAAQAVHQRDFVGIGAPAELCAGVLDPRGQGGRRFGGNGANGRELQRGERRMEQRHEAGDDPAGRDSRPQAFQQRVQLREIALLLEAGRDEEQLELSQAARGEASGNPHQVGGGGGLAQVRPQARADALHAEREFVLGQFAQQADRFRLPHKARNGEALDRHPPEQGRQIVHDGFEARHAACVRCQQVQVGVRHGGLEAQRGLFQVRPRRGRKLAAHPARLAETAAVGAAGRQRQGFFGFFRRERDVGAVVILQPGL